jgi:hypothetical protein
MTTKEYILKTGKLYRDIFNDNNMALMSAFMKGKSHKALLHQCYCYMVNTNVLVAIEKLPVPEKQRLFEIIKDFEHELDIGVLSADEITYACKGLYALELFLVNPKLGECLS